MRLWGLTPPQWRELPEDDREEMLEEFLAYCPSCGNLREVCEDPDRDWYPQKTVCWPTAIRESVVRRFNQKHEETKADPRTGLKPTDGVTLWVSDLDLSPDDNFL